MAKPKQPLRNTDEVAPIGDLKPHPRNYKQHPEAQLLHLGESLKFYGQYRRVIVARDLTILAGHGVVAAMRKVGFADVLITRYDIAPDSPAALKLVALDNESARGASTDSAALSALLQEINATEGLLGTGFDDAALEALIAATGEPDEHADGLPFPPKPPAPKPGTQNGTQGSGDPYTRVVQLYFSIDDHKAYHEIAPALCAKLGLANPSLLVMHLLREAHGAQV